MSVIDEHSILGIKNLFYQKLKPLLGEAAHVKTGLPHKRDLDKKKLYKINRLINNTFNFFLRSFCFEEISFKESVTKLSLFTGKQ